MAKNKTVETDNSVKAFIDAVAEETKKQDSFKIVELIKSVTGFEPKMWGPAIVGFGTYHYKYDSGREGDSPLVGFSPRKDAISLYMSIDPLKREELLQQFGKHKSSAKGCIYIKKLEDINLDILKQMVTSSVEHLKSKYGG